MPLNTRANRDEEFKQAIIQYEKTVIEPKLVEFVRSKPAAEGKTITIGFHAEPNDGVGGSTTGGLYYAMGTSALDKLGRNRNYILKIIGDLYRAEGYDVREGGRFGGKVSIDIKQPK